MHPRNNQQGNDRVKMAPEVAQQALAVSEFRIDNVTQMILRHPRVKNHMISAQVFSYVAGRKYFDVWIFCQRFVDVGRAVGRFKLEVFLLVPIAI